MQDAINERNDFRTPKFYWACLVILIIFLGIVFLYEGWAYISGLMGAVTLFAMERRQMRALTVKYKWKRSWAASVLVLEALLFFLIPLTGIIMMMIDVFTGLTIDFDAIIMEINQISELIEEKIGFDLLTIENLGFLPKMGSAIVQFLLANTYSIVMNGVIILFILFYMLYNYESFQQAIKELLPFNKENRQILLEESDQIIRANAIGIPLLAIIQGAFAYAGYLIFDIDNALFYSILTAFSTIIPVLGTMIIWVPLAIALALKSEWAMALGLFTYGIMIIGGVDNIARFLMQKKLADIHPLITIFGVIIGMGMFGFWGVIFGPLLLSLLVLFINMYRYEYIPGSKASPRITTKRKNGNIGGIRIPHQAQEILNKTMKKNKHKIS